MLTIEQVMKRLQLSRSTVKQLIADGELDVVHIGTGRGRPRIPERALLDYINRRFSKGKRRTDKP